MQTKYLKLLIRFRKFAKSGKIITLNDIENPKFASRYQIASGLCGPLHSMLDLCFYILLYMSILDGYRDFNRKKYINSKESANVYGDVCESRASASILPYFKG